VIRSLLGSLSLLLTLGQTVSASAQVKWEMTTEYPASNISGEGISEFAKLIAERSARRLLINPSFDASSGITSGQMLDAVRKGEVSAGDAFAGPLAAVDPIFAIPSLPFLVQSIDDARRLADLARPRYREILKRNGVHLLYVTIWPATGLWSKRPVATIGDLRSLSIRAYDYNSAGVMNIAGAKAESLPFGEAISKLRNGSLDAILSSGDGGAGRQLWDFLPNFTPINYAIPVSVAFVQSAAFDALPTDLQVIVDKAAADTEARQWRQMPRREEQNYDRMRTNGVTISSNVSPELHALLIRAAKATVDTWCRTADADSMAVFNRFGGRQ
jgi:TRAP-type C4-dicarboxylate transport system substrate-binding protein